MLWFVINTDLTIITEKLVELFATMKDGHVGIGRVSYIPLLDERLDLPQSKAAEIKRNYHSPSQMREAYLDLYATGHPCPSWRHVAEVLRGFGLHHQADVVESTYVQGYQYTHCLSITITGYAIDLYQYNSFYATAKLKWPHTITLIIFWIKSGLVCLG